MNADVEVRQVRSDTYQPTAYLNIDHSDGYVAAWTYAMTEDIVIVAIYSGAVYLLRFESKAYYDEWLEKNGTRYDKIIHAKDFYDLTR